MAQYVINSLLLHKLMNLLAATCMAGDEGKIKHLLQPSSAWAYRVGMAIGLFHRPIPVTANKLLALKMKSVAKALAFSFGCVPCKAQLSQSDANVCQVGSNVQLCTRA